jgi:hypothetical protein
MKEYVYIEQEYVTDGCYLKSVYHDILIQAEPEIGYGIVQFNHGFVSFQIR